MFLSPWTATGSYARDQGHQSMQVPIGGPLNCSVFTCVYVYICMYACVYIYIYMYRERDREREIHACIHIHTYIHTYIHIYIYIYTDTHIVHTYACWLAHALAYRQLSAAPHLSPCDNAAIMQRKCSDMLPPILSHANNK